MRVGIWGAGPAGASTALTLRQLVPEWEIVVLHRATVRSWQPGETLAPGTQALLRGLGLWERFLAGGHAPAAGTRAAWGSAEPYDNEYLFSAQGPGWHLNRPAFDAMLIEALQAAGIEIAAEATGPFDFVADCTGRAAAYAVSRGARRIADDRLIAAGSVVAGSQTLACTYVEAQESGWWYTTPLPGNRYIRAWMTDPDLYRSGHEGAETVLSACSQYLSPCVGEDWLAVGDAAAAFDPLSSQGIPRALRMGRIAAYTIHDAMSGVPGALAKYRRYIEAEYAHYRSAHRRFYRQENRWPDAPFWARRQQYEGDSNVQTAV